jgi:Domain of unknown function (DUF4349)
MKNVLLTLCLLVFMMACSNQSKNNRSEVTTAKEAAAPTESVQGTYEKKMDIREPESPLKPNDEKTEQAPQPSKPDKKPSLFSNNQDILASDPYLPKRKIIRTADLRFRVNNTEKATYNVENITKRFDGFVTETQLNSRIAEQTQTPISTDSVMEITKYEIENTMTLRVKNSRLDTVLAEITRIYAFLDHRHVRANDVTVEYMMDALKAKIREQSARRIQLATDEKGKKLSDIVNAEQTTVDMNDAAIEKEGSNMRKDFDTEYSTITLAMYQDVVIQSVVKVNPSVYAHAPSIWYRLSDSFRGGWAFVLDLMVGLVAIWPVFLLGGLGYWGYRRLKDGLGWNPLAFKK